MLGSKSQSFNPPKKNKPVNPYKISSNPKLNITPENKSMRTYKNKNKPIENRIGWNNGRSYKKTTKIYPSRPSDSCVLKSVRENIFRSEINTQLDPLAQYKVSRGSHGYRVNKYSDSKSNDIDSSNWARCNAIHNKIYNNCNNLDSDIIITKDWKLSPSNDHMVITTTYIDSRLLSNIKADVSKIHI